MSAELGHHDLCSIQWSEYCDCDPNNLIYLGEGAEDAEPSEEALLDAAIARHPAGKKLGRGNG